MSAVHSTLPEQVRRYGRFRDWLEFGPEGSIRVYTGKVEYGQGITTAIAQIVADELDVDLERVSVAAVDTDRSPDEGVTSGSRSVEEVSEALRRVAAEARWSLVAKAADLLGTVPEVLELGSGVITAPDGRQVDYGALADAGWHGEFMQGRAQVKPAAARSLIGQSTPRRDLPGKVAGRPVFIQDLELRGMLHARVARPPSYGADLVSVDAPAVEAMDGVRAVVRDGSFLAVITEREDQAVRALARLHRVARWRERPTLPDDVRFLLAEPTLDVIVHEQSASSVVAAELREFTAEYSRPYLAHASLGPSCAIARVDAGRFEVYSHTQGPHHLRQEMAKVLRVPESDIRVIHREGAGCYGANGADDAALDAALLARAVPGQPVRVQWMREDEFGWEPFGTAMVVRLGAGLTPEGRIETWEHEVWGNGHRDRLGPDAPATITNLLAARHLASPFEASTPAPPPSPTAGSGRNAAPLYEFPSQRVVNHYVARTPLRASALRSLGAHANVFAIESFIDEIAAATGQDPVAMRLSYLADERARHAVETVAAESGWARRPRTPLGSGLGMGFARYKNAGCYVAVVADVAIDDDVAVRRIWAVVDAGMAVNPDGILNQAEGGIMQSASWTLSEQVTFDATRITSRGWDTYPVLGFAEAPEIDVQLINRPDEAPLGVGEAFAGPTAAAIANAIFAASGVRLRDMPFTRDRIARAMIRA